MSSKDAVTKGKSFNTLFISFWKYPSVCANPKGTFRYSYFLKGDYHPINFKNPLNLINEMIYYLNKKNMDVSIIA